MQPLADKVALVTGATGLLGRQHCDALAEAGAHVIAADLDADEVAGLAATLEHTHGRPMFGCAADITQRAAVADLRERALMRFDRVDVLVNNAAIDDKVGAGSDPEASRVERYAVDRLREVLDVNVVGTFLCCQAFGSDMAARGSGAIVNVASTYGIVAPDQALYLDAEGRQSFVKGVAYPVSKAAVLMLTRYLASYWGPSGVRVNALSPGGVRSETTPEHFVDAYGRRTPLGRMAADTDYRGALVFLASESAAYMTGANLVVDGGFTTW